MKFNGIIFLPESPVSKDTYPRPLESQLEIPSQERLLPIGQHNKDISQLVDKVRQALGINAETMKMDNKKAEKCQNNWRDQQMQATSSQHHSPRKLIKQVALESPPNHSDMEDNGVTFKTAKMDNQSKLKIYWAEEVDLLLMMTD